MGVPAKMAVLFFINSKYPAVCVRKSPLDKSAHDNLKVDYCVPIFEMGMLLEKLTHARPRKNVAGPADVRTELVIAERILRDAAQVNELGSQVPYKCPNFGGVLWEMDHPDIRRFRCHTGHSFTESALLTSQSEEETLWTSLRTFEERKNLLNIMAATSPEKGKSRIAQRARETQIPIERIKAMVQASQQKSGRRTLAHVDELMAQPGMAASAQAILRWTMAAPFRCGVWKHSSTVPFPWQIGHTFARRTVPIPRHVGHRSFWIPQDRLRKDRPEQASVWRRLSQIYVWNLPKRPSEQN